VRIAAHTDEYTFSHIIHGFWLMLRTVSRSGLDVGRRLMWATIDEGGGVAENSNWIMNAYPHSDGFRSDYFGDSYCQFGVRYALHGGDYAGEKAARGAA